MGSFDLTCALSGLSTSWPGTKGPLSEVAIDTLETTSLIDLKNASDVRCSMFLLEQTGGESVPFSLPVTGFYDFYGCISLDNTAPPAAWDLVSPTFCIACKRTYPDLRTCPRHGTDLVPIPPGRKPSAHVEWIGQQLRALWERGVLVPVRETEAAPATAVDFFKLADPDRCGLRHAVNNTTIVPCLYLDEVATAIAVPPATDVERALVEGEDDAAAVYVDWLESHGRPRHAAYVRAESTRRRDGTGLGVPREDSRETVRLFDSILRWNEPRGFSAPGPRAQHTNAQIRETAHRAWKLGHPGLQGIILTKRAAWAARWSTADDTVRRHEAALQAQPAKPYRPSDGYAVGDVIEHPKFGRGAVEELVTPNKITVHFSAERKLLVHKPT